MAEQYTLKVVFEGDSSGLGKSAKSAENILSGFSSKISKLGESISGIGSKLTSSITKPALAAATALTSITLVKGWNRMTAIDDARIKLKALGLTAEEVSGVSEKALASVKGTAYGMDEAMTVASTAFAAGVTDMTDMERYLGNIADTAAVAGSSMEEIGSIFNKITTNGKATNETLQQLADRGLPVYQWLAEEADTTADAISEMAASGEINMSMLQDAIETHINGAAQTIGSQTIKGAISNMWASISRIGANFLGSADDADSFAGKVLPILNTLTDKLGGVEEKAKEWGTVFGEVFGYLYDYISTGSTNMDGLSDSAQRIIGKFQEISAAVTGWKATITGAVSGVVNKFGPLRSLVDLVKSKFSEMGITGKAGLAGLAIAAGPVTSALGKVVTVAGNIGSVIGKLNIADKFTGAISGIGSAASKISEFERKIFNLKSITSVAKSEFTSFGNIASKVGSTISGGFTSAINMAKNPITTLKSGLSSLASGFTSLATSPAGVITIIGLLVAAFVRLWNTSETFRNTIIGIVEELQGTLGPVLEQIKEAVMTMIETIAPAIDSLLMAMEPVVTTIVELLATLVSTAMPVISQIISLVMQIISTILPPLLSIIEALQPAIASVLSAVQTALPPIMTVIQQVISVISTIITVLSPIITFVANMISKIISIITPIIGVVSETIGYIFECIGNFKENVCVVFEAIGEFFGNIFESIGNVASTIWDTIKSVWDAASGFFSDLFGGIKDTVETVFGAIGDFISSIFDGVEAAWDGLTEFASGVCDGISAAFDAVADVVKGVINGVIAAINGAIWAINLIPGVDISPIDYLARGTDDWKGGFAVINEYGKGELVNLPNGSQVIPHDISMEYARESARVNSEGMGTERATEEIILSINNYVDVDGTQLNVRAYNYTVDAISSQQRAISIAKGETY